MLYAVHGSSCGMPVQVEVSSFRGKYQFYFTATHVHFQASIVLHLRVYENAGNNYPPYLSFCALLPCVSERTF